MKDLRALALYLPQFHPVPENDEWWGKGFTEWTNVAKSRPKFPGHNQPQLPADLGFYDLRVPETRDLQAAMAQQYGIHGFIYYHYWFNGRRILNRPFDEVLASGKPDFPFCLCWANENWTRRWDGYDKEILLKQEYGEQDDLEHIRSLAPAFADPRYIRVDGKPLFIVYRSEAFPDIRRTLDTWRNEAMRLGIGELYLVRMESFLRDVNPHEMGFDAAFDFQPFHASPPARELGELPGRLLNKLKIKTSGYYTNSVYKYENFINHMMARPGADYKRFPGVTPDWDNSARRKRDAFILTGSTPELYGKWLQHTVQHFTPYSPQENFIVINAWNEWAEGNHLEPDMKWGRKYLEATARALGVAY
ncbi:glycoside hydrolase family 99-like domain-containing protein [Hymenobacter sp. BT664]|uniref:Glycoside hydrolase family 99-like domain-containing protein n=1 Tax=Hymenobacter montanus TaxID=2771359 RepID=A0A927BA65_9BACT|nr:glycoside hydrolase family 99-like domain-containing protein [Hymenobacter montanus]MBD2766429.1 glycoside hydrolase family 99-like domain-containing protein [Hymenobacter montanus]